MTTIIRLENLSKDYTEGGKTRTVLRRCSAELEEGRFVAIRGRSGSGKSTLLNLIAGIDAPTDTPVTPTDTPTPPTDTPVPPTDTPPPTPT